MHLEEVAKRRSPDCTGGNQNMADRLMTVEEVAEYLRVKPSTVYKWAKEGKIPAAKVGWLWRFEREQIETWLRERTLESDSRAKRHRAI